jgi:hypothetical protein
VIDILGRNEICVRASPHVSSQALMGWALLPNWTEILKGVIHGSSALLSGRKKWGTLSWYTVAAGKGKLGGSGQWDE